MNIEQKIQAFRVVGKKYDFTTIATPTFLILSAKNTDGETSHWLYYQLSNGRTTTKGNTDNCNFWFSETRPDMTPEKIIQFVADLNAALELEGQNRFSVKELIDPEDWQEIAGICDADEDPRYTEE